MLKKILLSMGILSIGALCVYAATSGSQYVYYGTNKSKPSKPYSQPYTSPISKTNTQTTTQINQSEYPIYNYSNAEEPVITTTVGQLPAGSYILDKDSLWKFRESWDYSGKIAAKTPVVWQKIEDNHFQSGTTLLLSRYIVAVTSWRNVSINNDSRDWENSAVRDFLRTKFYNHISQKFKNAIVEVDIPYYDLNLTLKTVKDNFFVLSVNEWDMVKKVNVKKRDLSKEGKAMDYDDIEGVYAADSVNIHRTKCNYFLPIVSEKTIFPVATRTYSNQGLNFFSLKPSGYVNSSESVFYLRPAVNIKSSTVVKGPYLYEFTDCGALYKRKFYEIVE